MEMPSYVVYIHVDEKGRIDDIESSTADVFSTGWRKIDQGVGQRFRLARGNYFPKLFFDNQYIYRYMTALLTDDPDREALHTYEYEGETWGIYERTQEEMDADWVEPVPVPDPTERIAALEAQLAAYEAAYNQGVNEA